MTRYQHSGKPGGEPARVEATANDANYMPFPWPLAFSRSPVTAFVEIPLLGDPLYTSIEIQRVRFDDRSGLLAIMHRTDHTVDVYFESVLALDDAWRLNDPAVAHLPPGILQAVEMQSRTLNIGVDSIECDVVFRDNNHNLVQLHVLQVKGRGGRIRQFVPMPVNSGVTVLRLLLLDCFCMIRRNDSSVIVKLGEDVRLPAPFGIPVGFAQRYSARFSQPVLLVGLNPNGTYPLNAPLNIKTDQDGRLVSARTGSGDDWFDVRFEPALPRSAEVREGLACRGTLTVGSPLGDVTHANWSLHLADDKATPEMRLTDVTQNWFPSFFSEPVLSVLACIRWMKRRRMRLSWTGRLESSPTAPVMTSTWTSNRNPQRGAGNTNSSRRSHD